MNPDEPVPSKSGWALLRLLVRSVLIGLGIAYLLDLMPERWAAVSLVLLCAAMFVWCIRQLLWLRGARREWAKIDAQITAELERLQSE